MKKKQVIKGLLLSGVIVLATFTSCKKDFLDVNDNPNAPVDVSVKELLPSAELAVAHAVGNELQIYGGIWGQFWTQNPASSQYKTFENYSPSSDDFDFLWSILYSDALKDLKTIIDKGTAQGLPNYVACAKILQAYAFQLATDNFGDVPFSQALQEENGILSPRYDSQHDIYQGIMALAKAGIAAIDQSANAIVPADDDLLLAGDMSVWKKFGNTLLLRIYLRMSEVDPVEAAAGIAELEANSAEFLGAGEEVRINYLSAGGNTNPVYSSIIALQNVQNEVASATAVDYLNNNADLRVDAFYSPASNGNQVGIPQGDYTLPAGTPVSLPSPLTGANGTDVASQTAPVKLMTGYESFFLQSEAVARGWLTGDAQALYEAGITENFESYGFADTDAQTYFAQAAIAYPVAGTVPQKVEAIITQKWIAMCGNQNDEAWNEWRRTGYPTFFTISVNSILGPGRMPARFFYPSIEVTRNANFPGQHAIDDRVWWDVN